jgi:hypothetical protein
LNDTYSGTVIQSKHEVRLIVKTPNCITDPTIIVPIRVGNKAGQGFSGSPVYGAVAESAIPFAMPVPMGDSKQDSDIVVPSTPPPGWSNPTVYASVAVADPDIVVGGYVSTSTVSFDSLLDGMEKSLSDLEIVMKRTNQSEWDTVLHNLTPMQFGQLISKVRLV